MTREQGTVGSKQLKMVKKGLWCCNRPGNCSACPYNRGKDSGCVVALMVTAETVFANLTAEGLWAYCPDDEGRPRWKCSRCGKIVHKDPAEKLFCSTCGQRNRKEA